MESSCYECSESVDFFSGKICKFCNNFCCFKHLQDHLAHNCSKTKYAKYIRKTWLRKYGQNISDGRYVVKCDNCGYVSDTPYLIDHAGQKLEEHLQENKECISKKIFLEEC